MSEEAVKTEAAALKLAVRANEKIAVSVVYEDPYILVINKRYGLVVQPGKGHTIDTLLNGLFAKYGKLLHNLGERRDFGLLHRLDKDTSGLLIVAKHPNAYDPLRRDFESRNIDKDYLAIVAGTPKPMQGVVQARLKEIVEPGTGIKKVIVSRQGEEAISAYQVVSGGAGASLVKVRIKTGRLHQIRAHMLFLLTPVLGDSLYQLAKPKSGGKTEMKIARPPRLCLHAAHLKFTHPVTGESMDISAPMPGDLVAYAKKLGLKVKEG